MNRSDILIIETSKERSNYLKSIVMQMGFSPLSFRKTEIWFENLPSLKPGLVITGPQPLEQTYRFINTVKLINFDLPVIIITEDRAINQFIINNNFDNVITIKPDFQETELKDLITTLHDRISGSERFNNSPFIIGNDPEIIRLKKIILNLCTSNEPILINGERGTGKDLLARVLQDRSDRKSRPFIKVNCAALTTDRAEIEMLGKSITALTNVTQKRNGIFQSADGGIVYYNEIGSMPLDYQSELLRFMEWKDIHEPTVKEKQCYDVKIIASTSSDLGMLVEKHKFRKELYYRLNVMSVKLSPLRNRKEDISILTDYFSDKYCLEYRKSQYGFSKKIKSIFNNYHWPGNVSELENMVKSVVILGSEDSVIEQLHLENNNSSRETNTINEDIYSIAKDSRLKKYIKNNNSLPLKDICRELSAVAEKKLMKQALEVTNWNRKKAAEMLRISYKSLLNKIKAYNIT